ncbi:MAG: hypothetical protein ACYTG1_10615 [Planctomycetota bacterium]|jgi:hypothetical protein
MPEPPDPRPTASGRCHVCGYALAGLAAGGACPECGTEYTAETAARLKPWPSAFGLCCRLGWPVVGLVVAGTLALSAAAAGSGDEAAWISAMILGYAMIVAVAVNSYVQVRRLLKRSLPEQTRTRGPVAILRGIGTTVCVLILLVFVVGPFLFGVGCLIVLSQMSR